MNDVGEFAAIDLGASSGRVMLGQVGAGRLELRELHRFRNGPVNLPEGLRWDVLGLYVDVLTGLSHAASNTTKLISVGVDSWGADYGLLDQAGALIANPFHYRDERNARGMQAVHRRLSHEDLYQISGLQKMPFNTIYQMASEGDAIKQAVATLLIPDLFNYWLSGQRVAELTIASTTGMLDVTKNEWSKAAMNAAGVPLSLLQPLVAPGTSLGSMTEQVRNDTGLAEDVTVVSVASHDTASAVLAVPTTTENFAYISCGTWGLVGLELDAPILTEKSRLANFTNERGVDSTFRYLRNVMGLWLLQEALRSWRLAGQSFKLSSLLEQAASLPADGPVIDPNALEFLAPGNMPGRIAAHCRDTDQKVPANPVAFVRCILDSLAAAFASAVRQAAELSGATVDAIYIVGGGSRNDLLCQLTADACGLPVKAGPVEATAVGNLVCQAQAAGVIGAGRWRARELVAATHHTVEYLPRGGVKCGRTGAV